MIRVLEIVGLAVVAMTVFFALLCGWERACTSGGEYPHSGFTPDCPTWEGGAR